MTGFARREADTGHGRIGWELRSVNHRYLEVGVRLPEEFRVLEPRVRESVAAHVKRGKVDAVLHYRRGGAAGGTLSLDESLLGELVSAAQQVSRTLGQASPPDPVVLLRWPGVLREEAPALEPVHDRALELLDEALDDLGEGRAREGERTAGQILERAARVRTLVAEVRERLPEVRAGMRDKLTARVAELGAEPDPQRLEQELVLLAQRMDVEEELERLDGHVTELESVLGRDEPVGRRLDFLLQEFNREANTLASKSQDAGSTRAAVELKVLIEQVREQVQNLE